MKIVTKDGEKETTVEAKHFEDDLEITGADGEVPDHTGVSTGGSGSGESGSGKGQGEGDGEGEGIENFEYADIQPGDVIKGPVKFANEQLINESFEVTAKTTKDKKVKLSSKSVTEKSVRMNRFMPGCKLYKKGKPGTPEVEKKGDSSTLPAKPEDVVIHCKADNPMDIMLNMIQAGIINIWMFGPAGCGKSVMAGLVAKALDREFYVISCGEGTSASTFQGHKFPEPKTTRFSQMYTKPAIILLDEWTALEAGVAQIANGALANGILEITTDDPNTGKNEVYRHKDCIIIATSNTTGTGGSALYGANNALDGSTIDRFMGGMLEVDYSPDYESKFDADVVNFVWLVRSVINKSKLMRIASTRMIIEGCKLKKQGFKDWRKMLVIHWTKDELRQLLTAASERKMKLGF